MAFLDGGDAGEVQYGEHGACAEVDNVEIHHLVEFMFKKRSEAEDERFYGCKQERCDECADN